MAKKFAHIHLHTEYSLLDGLSKISDLTTHIKKSGMDSVAITDHGVMYGVIEFYKEVRSQGIKPIIGVEAYTTNVDMKLRPERGKFKNFHLVLLAKNDAGYKNLMKLTSLAHLEGYYYRPRIDRETLAKYSKGLICTSACVQGEVPQALLNNDYSEAKKIAKWFLDVFGKDYFLEVQRHNYDQYIPGIENQEIRTEVAKMAESEVIVNTGAVKLSRELGIPIVATNDAHYIKKEDAPAQDALVCIATGKNISDVKRMRFIDTPAYYVTTPEEMSERFSDLPEAVDNTIDIARKCNLEITLDKWNFPNYELSLGKTADEELEIIVWKGIKERIKKITPEIKKRLEYEMKIIKDKGYAAYFLIMADIAIWSAENGIVTNTRGSAAGSLVSYAMRIININPLDYNLPFERFLNPWRPTPPDIDLDIADNRREDIVNYICEKYGHEKVAQINTFGRMMAKASIRDTARVLGYQYAIGDRIAKLIPIGSQGFPMSIDKAMTISKELSELYESDKDAKKVINLAKQVEGNVRHVSVHAAGLVIAPDEITKFTPIQNDPEGRRVITQYDMNALDPNISPEAVGLLKFDLLGLRILSILGSAIKNVEKVTGEKVKLQRLPLRDRKTYEMLSKGDTMGVFQLSGSGMTRYLKELRPTKIEDLMAMVALYRPGPMAQIPEYILRKNNPSKIKYFDPRMKEYLGKSYGLLVYQDDVLLTAIKIAGYSWEEADKFRKAVGKKVPKEMEKQKIKFIEGAIKNGMKKAKAEDLFKLIEPFSGYGFNKAHATSYGMVAYQTAYMKANYPVEFMCALLTAECNDSEKISSAVHECRRIGIQVLPPDINESSVDFVISNDHGNLDENGIRFGLSAIKNVGKAAIEAILEVREEGEFLSFADFLARVDARRVNKKVLESLIKVGALSAYGRRAALLATYEEVRNRVSKPKASKGQQGLFSQDEISKSAKAQNIHIMDGIEEFSDDELQALERQLLGFSLSAKPLSEVLGPMEYKGTHKIFEISPNETLGDKVRIAAIVSEVKIIVTRKSGQEMAFVKVEDDTGSLETVVFPKLFSETKEHWVDNKPMILSGKIDNRDDAPSLIVESIETNGDKKNKDNQTVYIKIPKKAKGKELSQLKKLLLTHSGDQRVILVFEGRKEENVKLPYKITWNARLAKKITEALEGKAVPDVQ